MSYFYRRLAAQHWPKDFWALMNKAQDLWVTAIIERMSANLKGVVTDDDALTLDIIEKVERNSDLRINVVAPSELSDDEWLPDVVDHHQEDGSAIALTPAENGYGLVCLAAPSVVIGELDKLCLGLSPHVVLFNVLPPSAEKRDAYKYWIDLFNRLKQMGYTIYDPCGDDISLDNNYLHSSTNVALAVKSPYSLGNFEELTELYRSTLLPDELIDVISPEFNCGEAEVVSLRTAALASGGDYLNKISSNGIFDIYKRKKTFSSSKLEIARFKTALILPRQGWKVLADDRYYVEEIGPSIFEGLYNISHWRALDGLWGLNDQAPVVRHQSIPDGAFLLGGDAAYYHWIFNYLPRLAALELLDQGNGASTPIPIIVPARMPSRLLGILQKLLKIPFEIVQVNETATYLVNDLYVPSFYSSNEACLDVAEFYRSRLNISSEKGSRKIYISRSDARDSAIPRRKVRNEAEVIEHLQRSGFEAVTLGDKSADDQIKLFSEAEIIIGPHGAAFANLVFSPPGTKAIIFENSWNHTFIKDTLIEILIDADTLLCSDAYEDAYEKDAISRGEPESEIRRSRDMIVNLDRLDALLVSMLQR